jgi:hypothetical protein
VPDQPLYFSGEIPNQVKLDFLALRKSCLEWESTPVRPDFQNANYWYYLEICTAARKPSLIKGIINLDRSMAPKTEASSTEAQQSVTGPLGYHPVVEGYGYAMVGAVILFAVYRVARAALRKWRQDRACKQILSGIDAVDLSQTGWPSTAPRTEEVR